MTRAQQLIFADRLMRLKASGVRIGPLCAKIAEEVVRDNPLHRGTATMAADTYTRILLADRRR